MAGAQYCSVQSFIKQYGLVNLIGMCILQWGQRESEEIAAAFIVMVYPMETGPSRNPEYIINMDQSPIPFTFNRQRTYCPYLVSGRCRVDLCMTPFEI